MPKVPGTYKAIVRVRKVVDTIEAESKEAAIRDMLIRLANLDELSDFHDWVIGGMEIELARSTS